LDPLTLASAFALNDGHAMPRLGLGVYLVPAGGRCRRAVEHALSIGYRHVDTAAYYRNEADVGHAVRESGLPRREVFVTTKLWNSDQGYASALRAFDRSMQSLGLDDVDLYLIHWPEPGRRLDAWRALVEIRASGRARSIGVSNYTIAHLEELRAHSDIVPAVNQVEMSPFLQQPALVEYCRRHGIVVQAYCPLTHGERLGHPVLRRIAAKHARTTAQVMIRWALQYGVSPLPKSARPERITENAAVYDFALDAQDMADLAALDEGYRTTWDPTDVA